MKKNAMLKIAAILMVAVLLTTCAISSTFAKYVTSVNPVTTQATVANWGIKMTSETPTLFKNSYANTDGDVMAAAADSDALIIAPGTANDGASAFKFSIEGTPEVAFKLSATINVSLNNWVLTDGTTYYCPVVVKVNGNAVPTTGITKASDYEEAIEDAIAAAIFGSTVDDGTTNTKYEAEYAPNADAFTTKKEVKVTWEWPFEVDGNNEKDTALGNASTKATIGFNYSFTAEQIGAGSPTATDKYAR